MALGKPTWMNPYLEDSDIVVDGGVDEYLMIFPPCFWAVDLGAIVAIDCVIVRVPDSNHGVYNMVWHLLFALIYVKNTSIQFHLHGKTNVMSSLNYSIPPDDRFSQCFYEKYVKADIFISIVFVELNSIYSTSA